MADLTYTQALERAGEQHTIVLGPAACHTCGAWVEWAGVEWLALGTTERHDCTPYLAYADAVLAAVMAAPARVRPRSAAAGADPGALEPDSLGRDVAVVLVAIAVILLAYLMAQAVSGG